ncbi:MAG: type II toxin-antitoxin system Phd/YefM family antitoxin [Dehalococcoidia bacterium]
MTTIGIRELRQHASKYIAMVKNGERVEITDRGRPVALLTPLPDEPLDTVDRLVARGVLTAPPADAPAVRPAPFPARATGPSLSAILAEMRADERF